MQRSNADLRNLADSRLRHCRLNLALCRLHTRVCRTQLGVCKKHVYKAGCVDDASCEAEHYSLSMNAGIKC